MFLGLNFVCFVFLFRLISEDKDVYILVFIVVLMVYCVLEEVKELNVYKSLEVEDVLLVSLIKKIVKFFFVVLVVLLICL